MSAYRTEKGGVKVGGLRRGEGEGGGVNKGYIKGYQSHGLGYEKKRRSVVSLLFVHVDMPPSPLSSFLFGVYYNG